MQPPILSSPFPQGQQQDAQSHPYSDAHIASTLSLPPFSDFSKLRDDWAAKPLIRGRYCGLCGGDPAQRERREDFENITLVVASSSASSSDPARDSPHHHNTRKNNSRDVRTIQKTLPGQVEAYSRSAAGKIIDPHLQRTPLALEKAMHFLVEHYLRVPHTPLVYVDPFRIWGYLWDRFRGIRTTWTPQLPPSNVSVSGYVDSESNAPLAVDDLRRESYRRVRWLEFTAAALAVGGAYLCLTPKGCQRFMQDKKQFLESMSQCFTDLTVFYRAEQRCRNAEFFSVLLLLYGLNQEIKVEDRASFCCFTTIMVDGQPQLCPEKPTDSVNLAQVNRELEKQPYMLETQPVRIALQLIYCWSSRRWFAFFDLCRSASLTPLQRAVVFQSFTYARYRAVLDLVLPNYYVYPKLRVRHPMAVADLASQLMMEPAHCLQFLTSMGLGAQLELKPSEQPKATTSDTSAVDKNVWYLNLCQSNSDPLVTAEELEERCQNKRVLFFPTYPEFFGFRVWREAYARFPDAVGLPRPGAAAAGNSSCSPVGRGAVSFSTSHASHEHSCRRHHHSGKSGHVSSSKQPQQPKSRRRRHEEDGSQSDDDTYGGSEEDGFYTDEYMNDDDVNSGKEKSSGGSGSDDDDHDDADADADSRSGSGGSGVSGDAEHDDERGSHNSSEPAGYCSDEGIGDDQDAPPSPSRATTDAALLRQFGCPINLMEVLEVYCPPYQDEVDALTLVDASQELFAALREHRAVMLRRCRQARRRALHWQDELARHQMQRAGPLTYPPGERSEEIDEVRFAGDHYDDADDVDHSSAEVSDDGEAWAAKMEQESVSTCSSVFYSGDDDAVDEEAAASHHVALENNQHTSINNSSRANNDDALDASIYEQQRGAGVPAVVAEVRQLVSVLQANKLYAEAVADQERQQQQQQKQQQQQQKQQDHAAAAAAATLRIPVLALPETGSCSVVPLPDNYEIAEESSEKGRRCNSLTSRVIVESPATLPPHNSNAEAGDAWSLAKFDTQEKDETTSRDQSRANSAETVVPHSPTTTAATSGNNNEDGSASPTGVSKLFPSRPGQQQQHALNLGAARPVIPPLRFNTAMPKVTTASAAMAASPFSFASAQATAGAAATDMTTPKAAPHTSHDNNNRSGSSSSSSSSSAPMLEYSHLKRRTNGEAERQSEDDEDDEEEDEEEDIEESGIENEDDGQKDQVGQEEKIIGKTWESLKEPRGIKWSQGGTTAAVPVHSYSLSKSPSSSLTDAVVHLPPQSIPPPMEAVADSFTPRLEKATRRPRSRIDYRAAADGISSSTSEEDNDEGLVDSSDRQIKRYKKDMARKEGAWRPPPLPLAAHEVDVFAGVCLPLICEYLQLWAQLTRGDQGTLEAAAQYVLRARAVEQRDVQTSSSRSSVEADAQRRRRRCQALAHTLARRARELLTTALLRGSMSEYSQLMWDAATHASAETADVASTVNPDGSRHAMQSTSALGRLWTVTSDATSPGRRPSRTPSTQDVWAALLSRGCSAAVIPRCSRSPSCSSRSTRAAFPTRSSDDHDVTAGLDYRRRLPSYNGLDALTTSSAAAAATVHDSSRSSRGSSSGSSTASMNSQSHTNDAGLRDAAAVAAAALTTYIGGRKDELTGAITAALRKAAAAASATPDSKPRAAHAPDSLSSRADVHARSEVLCLDNSTYQHVAAGAAPPSPPTSNSSFLPIDERGTTERDAAVPPHRASLAYRNVFQLTSNFIFVSCSSCRAQAHSRVPSFTATAEDGEEETDEGKHAQQRALWALFNKEKECWLAQLLLPSPGFDGMHDSANNSGSSRFNSRLKAQRHSDLRNDRLVWLSPSADEAAAGGGGGEAAETSPLVARLYQSDELTHVPITAAGGVVVEMPLATRVSLYGCDVAALKRLRVCRDGGVRFTEEHRSDNNNSHHPSAASSDVPPSMVTSLAMSHAHYTAVVVVDLADPQAVASARHTLNSIVESHVPHTGVDGEAMVSANAVAGVLICAIESPASIGATGDSSSGNYTAVMAELEAFFRDRWSSQHGPGLTESSIVSRSSSVMGGRLRSAVQAASRPAVVGVRAVYGDASKTAAALAQGMKTLLATYAQQAVEVLALA